jgi:glycosyltransferase involved in cell wall biosynthesis
LVKKRTVITMPKISAVLITLNEEKNIQRTLDSLRWCDEIVVVDSFSTDQTATLCRRAGCRVFQQPFNGFGNQKQFAVDHARHDWILSIDADEVLTPGLTQEIKELLSGAAMPHAGYTIPRTLVFLGTVMRYGPEHRRPILRLFDRRRGRFSKAAVHEGIELRGTVGALQHEMLHYSYESVSTYFVKFNRYTTLAAQQLHEQGRTASLMSVVLRPPLEFLLLYVVRGFWLNGYPGLVWSLLSAMYPSVKYMKLRELSRAGFRTDEPTVRT